MKLDKRIKENRMPLTCFHIDEAKTFIGNKGYFTSDISKFYLLADCIYGTLDKIREGIWDNEPYHNKENAGYYPFFLPEESLKPKESTYVPFKTLNDLRDYKIRIGDPIVFYNKEYPEVRYSTIVTEIQFDNDNFNVIGITLGSTTYSLETLCNDYIWHCCNNEWVPFGKRVKE